MPPFDLADDRIVAYRTVIAKNKTESAHRPRPVWFGPSDAPLFGLVNSPDTQARGAVVICPPFGREYMNAVSYTHLDVYKRQVKDRVELVLPRPCPR